MKNKVVIFGAGAIGRGLLADVFCSAGYHVVFVEAFDALIEKLVKSKAFFVYARGKQENEHYIERYNVLSINDSKAVASELAYCSFAATAVGGANLETISGLISAGISKRKEVLNIMVCENWPHAEDILSQALMKEGCDKTKFSCIPCSVERMARGTSENLDVTVESGQSFFADKKSWSGPRPDIDGLLFCDDIEAYYKRKLYTNNAGHVLLAYSGYLKDCELLYEALRIPDVNRHLYNMLSIASEALVRTYSFEKVDMSRHVKDLLEYRFSNKQLADTVKRVARDPLRKLGKNERLVGLVRLLQKHNLPTEAVCQVIAAAMHYRDDKDSSSLKLAEIINEKGPEEILHQFCGFDKNETCFRETMKFFSLI